MVLLIALVVLATSLVRGYVVAPFSIPSGSMEQTLQVGDRILVDRVSYRFSDVHRGDIVVFDGTDTFGRLGNGTGETDYVKRVIGLPGDHVVCCDDPRPDHRQRTAAAREVLPAPRRRPVRPAVRHRGAGGPAVADGRPPVRLAGLPGPPR